MGKTDLKNTDTERTFRYIGSSLSRPDGWEKVSGSAKYIDDLEFPGMWYGKTIRSSIVSGSIRKIRRSPDFDWSKVVVISAGDLPGPNEVSIVERDMPVLADKKVNYCGEPILLIAAPDRDLLEKATSCITIETDADTPLLDMEDSIRKDKLIYGDDNLFGDYTISTGNPKDAFEEAELIVEGTYRTGYQEQLYLEPQGMIALPLTDGIEITGSMQCPYYIHRAACHALPFDPEKIVIKQAVTGGGFGGKEDYPSVLAIHAALLAMKAGGPVKMIYDREEDLLVTPKRHPSVIRHRTGVLGDGTIVATEIDILLDGGAYATLSNVVLQRAILHASGPYRIPNLHIRGRAVATNNLPSGAFRGFGVPQSCFAIERHMDRIARELNMDPLDIRKHNLLKEGDSFPFGQKFTEADNLNTVLSKAMELSGYTAKRNTSPFPSGSPVRYGVGLSLFFHGGGFTGSGEEKIDGKARISYNGREGLDILVSSVEMGQGASAMFTSVAAETMELPVSMFCHRQPDTSIVPDSGPTVASRTTMFVGRIVMDACQDLLNKLTIAAAEWSGVQKSDISYSEGTFYSGNDRLGTFSEMASRYTGEKNSLFGYAGYVPPEGMLWNDKSFTGAAYKSYSWGADVVEVEVDTSTWQVRPLKVTSVVEIGRVINTVAAEGQVIGGTLQALGYGYLEEMKTRKGVMESGHMTSYHIPTSMDCPEFQVAIEEIPYPGGPYGAKGLGELPMDGAAPALASAVENATGLFPSQIPVTGERLEELERTEGSSRQEDSAYEN